MKSRENLDDDGGPLGRTHVDDALQLGITEQVVTVHSVGVRAGPRVHVVRGGRVVSVLFFAQFVDSVSEGMYAHDLIGVVQSAFERHRLVVVDCNAGVELRDRGDGRDGHMDAGRRHTVRGRHSQEALTVPRQGMAEQRPVQLGTTLDTRDVLRLHGLPVFIQSNGDVISALHPHHDRSGLTLRYSLRRDHSKAHYRSDRFH